MKGREEGRALVKTELLQGGGDKSREQQQNELRAKAVGGQCVSSLQCSILPLFLTTQEGLFFSGSQYGSNSSHQFRACANFLGLFREQPQWISCLRICAA